jgi:hypothetical protein
MVYIVKIALPDREGGSRHESATNTMPLMNAIVCTRSRYKQRTLCFVVHLPLTCEPPAGDPQPNGCCAIGAAIDPHGPMMAA